MSTFTERQAEEVAAFKHDELARINIYDGSVRSGKTWITAVIWVLWLSTQEREGNFLMCGKTLTSLKRNVLDLLIDQYGAKHISYSIAAKTARIFGKTVMLEGASDARSEAKIRGLTLLGAYCDELTLFPEDFFAMLLSRLSEKGAKLFATTNPDSPMHWLWKGYLSPEAVEKKGLNLRHAQFLIDDNTTLEAEYLDNIKREYTGVFHDRYILGKWVVAEGAIYSIFTENKERYISNDVDPNSYILVGVDFGGNESGHAFTATAVSRDNKRLHVLKSDWIKATGIAPNELDGLFAAFLGTVRSRYPGMNIKGIYCDSAEQVLINGFRASLKARNIHTPIHNAVKGSILNRIRLTLRLMALDRLKLTADCKPLVEGLERAVYDDKDDNKRLDNGTSNIDSLDSFEYSFENVGRQLSL